MTDTAKKKPRKNALTDEEDRIKRKFYPREGTGLIQQRDNRMRTMIDPRAQVLDLSKRDLAKQKPQPELRATQYCKCHTCNFYMKEFI